MRKIFILLFTIAVLLPSLLLYARKITITIAPNTANIIVNGVSAGTGKAVINIPKNGCVVVEINLEGFVAETRRYCNKKGVNQAPKIEYIQLDTDESYSASIPSPYANTEVQVEVKPTKTTEEAWKQIVSIVLSKFDVLENNDLRTGYMLTGWNGSMFKTRTLRTRLFIRMISEDPLVYKVKLVSEVSGKPGTTFNADEQFQAWSRILKKYDGFIEELTSKLRN